MDLQSPRWNDTLRRPLRLGAAPVTSVQKRTQAKSAVRFPATSATSAHCSVLLLSAKPGLCRPTRERLALCGFVRILLSLIDLLLELLCLFLVGETQTCQAIFQFEGVEKGAILIVLEGVIYLLVPDYATVGWRDIHELNEVCITHEIVSQDCSALQASVGPSSSVRRVCNVELSDGYGVDLVGGFGNSALDSLLVVVRED